MEIFLEQLLFFYGYDKEDSLIPFPSDSTTKHNGLVATTLLSSKEERVQQSQGQKRGLGD